jgi:hypothetical protein
VRPELRLRRYITAANRKILRQTVDQTRTQYANGLLEEVRQNDTKTDENHYKTKTGIKKKQKKFAGTPQ